MTESYTSVWDGPVLEWWFDGIPLRGNTFPNILNSPSTQQILVLKNVGGSVANLTDMSISGTWYLQQRIDPNDLDSPYLYNIQVGVYPASNTIAAQSETTVIMTCTWTDFSDPEDFPDGLLSATSYQGMNFIISTPFKAFPTSTIYVQTVASDDLPDDPVALVLDPETGLMVPAPTPLKTQVKSFEQMSKDLIMLNPGEVYYGAIEIVNPFMEEWSSYTGIIDGISDTSVCEISFFNEDLDDFELPFGIPAEDSLIIGFKLELHKPVHGFEIELGLLDYVFLGTDIEYKTYISIFSNFITETFIDGWYEDGVKLGASFPDIHSSNRMEFRGSFIYDFNTGNDTSVDINIFPVAGTTNYVPIIDLCLISSPEIDPVKLNPDTYRDIAGNEDYEDWILKLTRRNDVLSEPTTNIVDRIPAGSDSVVWISESDDGPWILYSPHNYPPANFNIATYKELFKNHSAQLGFNSGYAPASYSYSVYKNLELKLKLPKADCYISDDGWYLNGWEDIDQNGSAPVEVRGSDFLFQPGVTYYYRVTLGSLKNIDNYFHIQGSKDTDDPNGDQYAIKLDMTASEPNLYIAASNDRISYPSKRVNNFLKVATTFGIASYRYPTQQIAKDFDTSNIERPWIEFTVPGDIEYQLASQEPGDPVQITFIARNTGTCKGKVSLEFGDTFNYANLGEKLKLYQNFDNTPTYEDLIYPLTIETTLDPGETFDIITTWYKLNDVKCWDYEEGRDYYSPYIEPTNRFLAYLATLNVTHDDHDPQIYDSFAYPDFGYSGYSYSSGSPGGGTAVERWYYAGGSFGNPVRYTYPGAYVGVYSNRFNNLFPQTKLLKILEKALVGWTIGAIWVQ